jgi:tRNA (cmo5U34)-methyltransferase
MDNSSEMLKIINDKIKSAGVKNLNFLNFDLEKSDYTGSLFDIVFTQMVLHHVKDIENVLKKFHNLLNPGGYLAIADLYPEDGSFHGIDFTGHKGFDVDILSEQIRKEGFKNISHRQCFVINKKISDSGTKQFGVFLLIASRN